MTDEIKDIPEHAPDAGFAEPPKARKQKVAVASGSTIGNSSQPRVAEKDARELDTTKSQALRELRKRRRQGDHDTGAAAPRSTKHPSETKTGIALKALGRKRGASIAELQEITGWQSHSVRGFLSGAIKKKLGLHLVNEIGKDGIRRYRVDDNAQARLAGQAG